jgi:uncharacterized protein YdcH (DUF465 family)
MEQRDLELIKKYRESDKLLGKLYDEHVDFEKQLDEFNNKSYLTPDDEIQRKMIQKKKLLGRDQIEAILAKYRKMEKMS